MKEEIADKLAQLETAAPEISFSISSLTGEITIEFADGERQIPEYIVKMVGGIDKLKEIAPALKAVNYIDFAREFNIEIERQKLNDMGRNFVGKHFNRRF
jgi:hypothetical protein